jgi:methylenetetrahydrofolate reductase (NADPH)
LVINATTGIEPMAHLTCVGHTKAEIADVLSRLAKARIENVLALRGDPPKGQTAFQRTEGGFGYANELVEFVREQDLGFGIGGAAYPEGHPETASREADLQHLKLKVDAGCDFVVCQLFFDNAFYFDFVERARRAGINVPIVPGIMPIGSFSKLARFSDACGAELPRWMRRKFEGLGDDVDAIRAFGLDVVTELCQRLLAGGAPGLHFYSMNQSVLTLEICRRLQLS